jgi:hypothetical protein
MGAEHSRQQADRCLLLAEEAPSAKLRIFLIAEARAWNCLAEDQEWLEQRSAERRSNDKLASFPTIHALVSGRSGAPPSKRRR